MRTNIDSSHYTGPGGNPTGGATWSIGLSIAWQRGPLGRGADRKKPNGAFAEDVIAAALDRIQFYQQTSAGKFACRQNAITKLKEALFWLNDRTEEREARRVEGTHEA